MKRVLFSVILLFLIVGCNQESGIVDSDLEDTIETRREVDCETFLNLRDDAVLTYAFSDSLDGLQSADHDTKMKAIAQLTEGQQHLLKSVISIKYHRMHDWYTFFYSYLLVHEDTKDDFLIEVQEGLTYLGDSAMLAHFNKCLDTYYDSDITNKENSFQELDREFDDLLVKSIINAASFVKDNPEPFVILVDKR